MIKKSEQDTISVIVPAYQTEDCIDRCIKSITKQTYENLEIVVIDDGSTDQTGYIADAWAEKDARIKVIHTDNNGLVRARKEGLKYATGDYVGYVDADDWIDTEFYEYLYSKIIKYDCDMVASGRIEETEESRYCRNNTKEGIYSNADLSSLVERILCDENGRLFNVYPTVWDKLFKKKQLIEIQNKIPDDIHTGEDVAVTIPYVLQAKSVYISNECMYHYNRTRSTSMTLAHDDRYFERLHILADYLKTAVAGDEREKSMRLQIDRYIHNQIHDGIYSEWRLEFICIDDAGYVKYLFPFEKIERNSTVIVYGAGNIGRSFVRQIKHTDYCRLVLWVDQSPKSDEISEVECIYNIDFDYIVIAIAKKDMAEQIRKMLINAGINEKRIIWRNYKM